MSVEAKRAAASAASAVRSSETVCKRAKAVTKAITDREKSKRARTEPFARVELHEDDSLVTSIDTVIARTKSKPEIEPPVIEVTVDVTLKEKK